MVTITHHQQQGNYAKNHLSSGEELKQVFQHHWLAHLSVAIHFLIALCSLGVWLPVFLYKFLALRCREQFLTTKKVVTKNGIISINTDEMRLAKIENVIVQQSILGRLFGYGKVTLTGTGSSEMVLKWMTDPRKVKRQIEDMLD